MHLGDGNSEGCVRFLLRWHLHIDPTRAPTSKSAYVPDGTRHLVRHRELKPLTDAGNSGWRSCDDVPGRLYEVPFSVMVVASQQ